MELTENNYIEIINNYTKKDWLPLLKLIPMIEGTKEFDFVREGIQSEDGFDTMPYTENAEIVSGFIDVVHDIPVIISFDWGSWNEGRRIARDEKFDFNTIDIPAKCKLITAIVRNDRFYEGALVNAFESGLILRIIKSIEKQLD